jgi:hypothetical protein
MAVPKVAGSVGRACRAIRRYNNSKETAQFEYFQSPNIPNSRRSPVAIDGGARRPESASWLSPAACRRTRIPDNDTIRKNLTIRPTFDRILSTKGSDLRVQQRPTIGW